MKLTLRYEETGEYRCPNESEWFRGNRGFPVQAQFDFNETEFHILRQIVEEVEENEPN